MELVEADVKTMRDSRCSIGRSSEAAAAARTTSSLRRRVMVIVVHSITARTTDVSHWQVKPTVAAADSVTTDTAIRDNDVGNSCHDDESDAAVFS